MLVKQLIAITGWPLFEIWREHSWKEPGSDGWSCPQNCILVCPSCQRCWAFLDFQTQMWLDEPARCLWPRAAFCEDCPTVTEQYPVPGSLLFYYGYGRNIDLPMLEALPEALLKREFELHLRQFD